MMGGLGGMGDRGKAKSHQKKRRKEKVRLAKKIRGVKLKLNATHGQKPELVHLNNFDNISTTLG